MYRSRRNMSIPVADQSWREPPHGSFVAEVETIYSCEGTHEMNTLIVGKVIRELSAFV